MKTTYLALQADYENISLSVWHNTNIIDTSIIDKTNACQLLMPSIVELLKKNLINFSDLNFIAINKGPAPFTTLRIVITTANGLNFAHKTPLIAVNALEAFAHEYKALSPLTIIILNAFAQDVYFAIIEHSIIKTGCINIDLFLQEIINNYPEKKVTFIGNGTDLFKEKIKETFKNNAMFLEHNPQYTNFKEVALTAYSDWKNKTNISETVLPLYLKIQTYKSST